MREALLVVTEIKGLYVWATGPEGDSVGFGDVHGWVPVLGETLRVTLDSDDFPVRVEHAQGDIFYIIWP